MNDNDISVSKESIRQYIGRKIKKYRLENNWTQEDLANKLFVKNNTISAYERGVVDIDANTIYQLAKIFSIKVDDFFPKENENKEVLDEIIHPQIKDDLDAADLFFFKKIVLQLSNLNDEEREKLMNNLKFAVEFFNKD